jgi:lipoprotein-anchoring transpeptidase ErfK/SrfK
MNRATLLRALVATAAVLLVFTTAAGAAPRGPRTYGPTLSWGTARVRSLDPWPAGRHAGNPLLAGSGSLAPSGSGLAQTADDTASPPPDQVLSNETTFTSWAYTYDTASIYKQASLTSSPVGRLHWYTEDGFPEVYLVLSSHWDALGQQWLQVRIPRRPNGTTGWVQRSALGALHLTHQLLVVNREKMRMYLYANGHLRWSAPVGVGKRSTPTPTGHFWIRERFKITDRTSGYWPFAFGTSDYSTLTDWPGGGVVGIHGPYFAPQGIPGRISHGCIRLETVADSWLAHHMGVGTPVHVI